MQFRPKLGIYKDSNGKNTFNPETCEAHSYGHWQYVRKIKNKVVFNAYKYSVTTGGHQSEMRSQLKMLGIRIDLEVNTSDSLTRFESCALGPMYREIFELESVMARKGAKLEKNTERLARIKRLKADIKAARALGAKLSPQAIKALRDSAKLSEAQRVERMANEAVARRRRESFRKDLEVSGEVYQATVN